MKIHGWGKYPVVDSKILLPQTKTDCAHLIQNEKLLIPRGLGRSYGDSANASNVLESTYLDHFIELDEASGILVAEAGLSLREILQLTIPKGWFVSVTPGTSYVTVGGAIASDVHGKNHHVSGTFTEHVLSIELMLGTGEILKVSRNAYPDLFRATCGGMGLTGFILSATIQLKPIQTSQIIRTIIRANSLEEVCEQFKSNSSVTYSVAWIDCLANGNQLGRSLLMLGEHAEEGCLESLESKDLNVAINMPAVLFNRHSIKVFNAFYYHKALKTRGIDKVAFSPYFYPLDAIRNWNRLYGEKGFVQYQFVLPKAAGIKGLKRILTAIVESGKGSFLAVLKVFGKVNNNYLSFPIEGYTLALDFKMCEETIKLISELDVMVISMGGRIYLTKDALMSESTFKVAYPQWEQFEQVRAKYGAIGKFASNQSKRLGLQ